MTQEKVTDLVALQDIVTEFAKDLIWADFAPLLAMLDIIKKGAPVPALPGPLFFVATWEAGKLDAFHRLVVALHAASAAAEDFRVAHLDEERKRVRSTMERQFAEELARVDSLLPEEIAARKAS
jgi:hypothetical protein